MIHRRSFITGLVSFVAAPAIVRASSLMPVKVLTEELFSVRLDYAYELTRKEISDDLYGNLSRITREAFLPRLYAQLYPSD